jgi:nucleoside-diphosphate-sugar epimerase
LTLIVSSVLPKRPLPGPEKQDAELSGTTKKRVHNMRILIFGGAGFIGSHLVAHLVRSKAQVTVVDANCSYGGTFSSDQKSNLRYRRRHLLHGAHMIEGDVRHELHVQNAIAQSEPDCVLYLAAVPSVQLAKTHVQEATDSMIRGLTGTLQVVRKSKCVRRFVYVSSSMVYGDFEAAPISENAKTEPLNLYGGLKLAGEVMTRAYLGGTSVETVIIRPSGVYGPTDIHGRVVQAFCEGALSESEITVINGRDTIIDFTWVEDLVDGLARAATHPSAVDQTFNMTFGEGRSLDDLVRIVSTLVPGAKVVRTWLARSDQPRRGSMDTSRARQLIGYRPVVDLETGIARYLDFLRTKPVFPKSTLVAQSAIEPARL